jgi:general secretion pathway protein D
LEKGKKKKMQRVNMKSSTRLLDRSSERYNKQMKQVIAIVFCALFFAVSFFTGCAGRTTTTQIKDKGVTAEVAVAAQAAGAAEIPAAANAAVHEKGEDDKVGAQAAGTAERPAEKTYADKQGKFEIVPTPFGYVKRDIKRVEKELSLPLPGQPEPVVPLTPVVKAPAVPPALKAEQVSLAPGPPGKLAEGKAPGNAGQISFDFDDADLYAVIRTMADLLNINYIIDPAVSGKVTIHTAGLLRIEDIFPIFYQTLEVNGLTAVKEGNLYRILKLRDALRMPIASRLLKETKDIPSEERIIIQIIPLKFISAQEAAKVLIPFISADGTIVPEGGSNTLLVVDKGINIFKVLKLVEVLDVSVFEKINYRFYNLKNVSAEDASKALGDILSLSAGGGKDDVKFIPIRWLNALLIVSSSPDIFVRVDTLISQLDKPSEGAQPQIYVYSVKNGMATELGDTLRSIFGKGGELKKSAGKESVPTNPFAKSFTEKKTLSTSAATATPAAIATPAATAKSAATETGSSATLRGDIRITADPIRNALIIEAIPGDYQLVEKILGRLDVLPRQVLIEVVIAEISLGKGTELGIEWTFKKDNWIDTGSLSASVGASGLQYALGLSQKWQVALHALASESKLNIISSPSILASDNKQARIDVTTEVPIPSTSYTIQTTGSNLLETKVEYRNTGVILDVTPHINEYGLVTMDISQEVSNVGTLLKVADKDYYSFDTRKILTSLTVKHNQSIVIGGLISSKKSDAAAGVPWLVNIPLIRWLFGTETKNVSKSELIVMITPRVITSLDDVDAVSEEFKKKIGNAMTILK